MDLEAIKQDVIHSESPTRLYELMIELTEEISKLHVLLVKVDDIVSKTEIKGRISLLSTLQTIIDKRLDEVRSSDKEKDRNELLYNRQFKLAAEAVLTKETYAKVKELSTMNYHKFRGIKAELKANKIE
jgi:hypothetical protein